MTSVCPSNGPSESIPGFNLNVVLSATSVESALILAGFPEVAAILAPLIAGGVYDLTTFCTGEPAGDPGLTGTDVLNAVGSGDITQLFAAVAKVKQWWDNQYWYDVCQCVSGTATPPTVSNPGPVSTSPGLPGGTVSSGCWSGSDSYVMPSGTPVFDGFSGSLVPLTPTQTVTPGTVGMPNTAHTIPAGALSFSTSFTLDSQPISLSIEPEIQMFNSSGTVIQRFIPANWNGSFPLTQTAQESFPTGTTAWALKMNNGDGAAHTISATLQIVCSGTGPTTIVQPCCPPDPLLQGLLTQILAIVTATYSIIPARVPNYAANPVHTGVTDGMSITLLSTTIAVLVTITTFPVEYGTVVSTPTTYIDIGFVTPVNNEGPEAGIRLTRSPEVIPLPEATLAVAMSLPPGEVVSVTELQAG